MNRKTYISLFVIVLLPLILGIAYIQIPEFRNFFVGTVNKTEKPVYEMSGRVAQSTGGYIIVRGKVGMVDREIRFVLTPETALNKTIFKITSTQIKSGKTFAPDITHVVGLKSDLASSTQILRIKSKENLESQVTDPKTAIEINYLVYDTPTQHAK